MSYLQLFEKANGIVPVSLPEWEEFSASFVSGTAVKGELLVRPGEESIYIWIVLKGIIRNYDLDEKGKEYTKVFRGPGESIGPYPELLEKTKARFFIQSVTDSQYLRFPYRAFESMMDKYKNWERMGRILAELNFLEKEKREFDLMHLSAEARYNEFVKLHGDLVNLIPQYQVASNLAVSPEALNRMLKARK